MKKIIIVLFFLIVISVFINDKKSILIPENAIRFRIIANSNSKEDQEIKMEIKDSLESELYKMLENANNINDARTIISSNLYKVDDIVNKYNVTYDISYGKNFFPEKSYKGVSYKEGNYESLVVTLGEGIGDNWWCVLFPPLCLLDQNENIENAQYELYASKLVNKFN